MISVLCVPDEVVIGFFTAAMAGLSGAVVTLWKDRRPKDKD